MRSRIRLVLLLTFCMLLITELSSRYFWASKYRLSFWAPRIEWAYYPELKRFTSKAFPSADTTLDVLLLGASVIQDRSIAFRLEEQLEKRGISCARVHNAAKYSHTTFDSFRKLRSLQKMPIDIVVVYHGINDVRANNCPKEVFREDYSHFLHNRKVRALDVHPEVSFLTFPYTFHVIALHLLSSSRTTAPPGLPRKDWMVFGSEIKSKESFRANLYKLAALAHTNSQTLICPSFAYHCPPNYSPERFEAGTLDYSGHDHAIEKWGLPKNVCAAIDSHNRELLALGDSFDNTRCIRFDESIPKTKVYFNDICHLTSRGKDLLIAAIADGIVDR